MANRVHIEPKRLLGIQGTGPSSFNEEENSGAEFGKFLWGQFIGKLEANHISLDRTMYGVSWPADDLTPPQYVYYFCGFESTEDFQGLTELSLEGGNYFEYNCEVPAVDIDKGFQDAYMKAMPASGLKEREGQHIEIYGEDYDPASPIAKFKILIPVE